MRLADILDSGIRAWYFASMSLHSIPRGADPLGASTELVNRWPDFVTIVTPPPQPHSYFTAGGAGSASTRSMRPTMTGFLYFDGLAWIQVKSLSATAAATK